MMGRVVVPATTIASNLCYWYHKNLVVMCTQRLTTKNASIAAARQLAALRPKVWALEKNSCVLFLESVSGFTETRLP